MYIVTTDMMKGVVRDFGAATLISMIWARLVRDFRDWDDFVCSPRFAHYVAEWVVELMPIGNKDYFSYKYVNGHPENVSRGYSSVLAIGQLSDCHTGIPLLLSEMTMLTALRTAATTQLAALYGARADSSMLAIIGNGSQSVFQTIAICEKFPITRIRHYDIDDRAMETFRAHVSRLYPHIALESTNSSHESAQGSDIIVTVTEAFGRQEVVRQSDVKSGAFIAWVGGDCPGKTELDPELVAAAQIVVEYEPQTRKEGEIQRCPDKQITAHIHELVRGLQQARQDDDSIVLFDSVGFALEDYSALQVIHELAQTHDFPRCSLMLENMRDVKDLYGESVRG